MANDRLFVRATDSDLLPGDPVPRIAYLPSFAGMTDREAKVTQAIRTRRIGEGLAGAVLRNILLELQQANASKRAELRAGRSKISDPDLSRLRTSDPWELLQATLREQFSAELIVEPFREEYHSYIRVDIDKGAVQGYKLKRHPRYNRRDLMVEGSGFLQWLSVYALAASGDVDVLLLDEPDAHLHPTLQAQLLNSINVLAESTGKQILVATHSTEILRNAAPESILEVRPSGTHARYLSEEHHKVGLLAGLGSEYAPRIDHLKKSRRAVFVEGTSDVSVLEVVARTLGRRYPGPVTFWITPASHRERRLLFRALQEEIPGLQALSLRDRDDEPIGTTGSDLRDKSETQSAGFTALKWRRRHIESYLIVPAAVSRATGLSEETIKNTLAQAFGLAISDTFTASDCPSALLDAQGKAVLTEGPSALLANTGRSVRDVAAELTPDEICEDLITFLDELQRFAT